MYIGIALYVSTINVLETKIDGKLFIISGGLRSSAMVDRIIKESGIDKSGWRISSSFTSKSWLFYDYKQR